VVACNIGSKQQNAATTTAYHDKDMDNNNNVNDNNIEMAMTRAMTRN